MGAERRAQQLRSDTRSVTRLLAGLNDIDAHRGGELSEVGAALRLVLSGTQSSAHSSQTPQRVTTAHAKTKTSFCRHFLRGNCTYADRCSFAHEDSDLGQPCPAHVSPQLAPSTPADAANVLNPDAQVFIPAMAPVVPFEPPGLPLSLVPAYSPSMAALQEDNDIEDTMAALLKTS